MCIRDSNQGISDARYWLRFRLVNDGNNDRSWVIQHETSYLDNLVVHYRDSDGDWQRRRLSDRQPFASRQVDFGKLSFRHTTPAGGATTVYLQLYFDRADALSLNFHLHDSESFREAVQSTYLVYGGYYGALLVFIAMAVIGALVLRRASPLFYALFLCATAFKWSLFNGVGFQYLWPSSVFIQNEGFHIAFLLFVASALQFSRVFLKTRDYLPGTDRAITLFQGVVAVGIALRILGFYEPVLHLAFAALALLALLLPVAGWRAWRKGLQYARWYTLAWIVYSAGLLLSLASAYTELLPGGMQALSYLQVASLFEVLLLMVAMAERVLSLERDRREAVVLANQDTLTQLGNRRFLQVQYEQFKERFARNRVPVFLIMIDLDYFKQVNDRYGHEAGDVVLKHMADLLRQHSRHEDVCVRYGGEEFAILLQAVNVDAARDVAERIRTAFAGTPTTYEGENIDHTLSAGIAPVISGDGMLSVREMMARADAALYESKASGRNRTVVHLVQSETAEGFTNSPVPGRGYE